MKISKMMLHYISMFTIPTAVAFYYWNPESDEDIRKNLVRLPQATFDHVPKAFYLTVIHTSVLDF